MNSNVGYGLPSIFHFFQASICHIESPIHQSIPQHHAEVDQDQFVRPPSTNPTSFQDARNFELSDQLPPYQYVILRLDGRSFHRFTRLYSFTNPTTRAQLERVHGARAGCGKALPEDGHAVVYPVGPKLMEYIRWRYVDCSYPPFPSAKYPGHVDNTYNAR